MFSSIWIDFLHEITRRYARHAVYRKSVVSVALFARYKSYNIRPNGVSSFLYYFTWAFLVRRSVRARWRHLIIVTWSYAVWRSAQSQIRYSTRAKMNNLINVVNNLLQCCSQQLATMLCCTLSTTVVNKHCSRLLEQLLFTVDESTRCEQCCWNSSEQRDNSIVKRLTNQQGLNNVVGTA